MLLTKDNLLRFVQQQKYTTPTTVAKEFETTTTIASAALGELTNGGGLGSTHIKYGTTPYYYDLKQKECLTEIALKSFTGTELELLTKIKNEQIVSLNTLTIPQRAILQKLQDIFYEIQVKGEDKAYTFLIWYLRDEKTTRQQIQDAIFGNKKSNSTPSSASKFNPNTNSNVTSSSTDSKKNLNNNNSNSNQNHNNANNSNQNYNPFSNLYSNNSNSNNTVNNNPNENNKNIQNTISKNNNDKYINNDTSKNLENSNSSLKENSKSREQEHLNLTQTNFDCDRYLYENGYTILEKEKHQLGFIYKISIQLNEFTLFIDALYTEQKKIQLKEILEFYTSSMKPKMIFHTNIPRKIENTIKEFENCMLIEIKQE
ncbi:MAG: hypothetical protein LAT82_03225 [Nanoarchaeota archaeon]|nr:hypothetical protein [Nanoarchaeota archaeon]